MVMVDHRSGRPSPHPISLTFYSLGLLCSSLRSLVLWENHVWVTADTLLLSVMRKKKLCVI